MTTSQKETRGLTAAELRAKVMHLGPKVAVFDCDGTLWDGDAGVGFLNWSLEQGIVSRSTSDWIDMRHRAYRAGQVSEVQICGEMVQIYAGLREEELRGAAARYFAEWVKPHIFEEMKALIEDLHGLGAELWAVSSTNKWIVLEGIREFGISPQRVLAAEAVVADGIITSELVDVPTDEGKAASLRRVGLAKPDAVFGNSIHDVDMLEMAAHGFAINPSPELLQAAARHGWTVFQPDGSHPMISDIS